jgi:hypothetical protein
MAHLPEVQLDDDFIAENRRDRGDVAEQAIGPGTPLEQCRRELSG